MRLPFTPEQFVDSFHYYNVVVWPTQLLLYGLGLGAVALALKGGTRAGRPTALILGVLWLWTGAAFHLTFFTAVTHAAYLFGALCIVQGALLIHWGVVRGRVSFHVRRDLDGVIGASLIAYALVLYPLLGATLGHRYPASPTFGLPCPTTIFTFGLLFWAARPIPRVLLAVPLLWALIGSTAAFQLGMIEDLGLLVAAALAAARLLPRARGLPAFGTRAPNVARAHPA